MKVVLFLCLSSVSAFVPAVTTGPSVMVSRRTMQPISVLQAAGPAVMDKSADSVSTKQKKSLSDPITKDEVRAAVRAWCDGIVDIGSVFQSNGDYKAKAIAHIDRHYAFDTIPEGSRLLFKPTLASEYNFRSEKDEFISYFIGDGCYSEDGGFAIKPWSAVRFDTHGVYIAPGGVSATTSGIYHFTPAAAPDTQVKVEYTFQFVRSKSNPDLLKIVLHHSSVPFSK